MIKKTCFSISQYEISRGYIEKHVPYRLTRNNSACGDAEKVSITSGIVGAASQKSQYEKKLFFFNFYCRYEITRDYKKTYSLLTHTVLVEMQKG
jgi:hypothetical protein